MRRLDGEALIQARVVVALRRAGIRFWHTPNEGKHTPAYRAKLHTLGVESGVPDLVIVTPPPVGGFVGTALELKTATGRLSKTQSEWLAAFTGFGWAAAVAYGLDDAMAKLRLLGYGV